MTEKGDRKAVKKALSTNLTQVTFTKYTRTEQFVWVFFFPHVGFKCTGGNNFDYNLNQKANFNKF